MDDIKHVTRMEVDENGTTAAAVTISVSRGASTAEVFLADHPFVFTVYDTKLNQVLFNGVFCN